jgi:hypothetical protein
MPRDAKDVDPARPDLEAEEDVYPAQQDGVDGEESPPTSCAAALGRTAAMSGRSCVVLDRGLPGAGCSTPSPQRREHDSVLRRQPWTADLPAQYRDFVTQHQQLEILGCLATGPKDDQTKHRPNRRVRDRQQRPNYPAEPAQSRPSRVH